MSEVLTPNFNKVVAVIFFCSIMFTNHLLAAGGDNLAIKSLYTVNFTSDFGTPVDTYEDVEPITNIGYTLLGNGPTMAKKEFKPFENEFTKKGPGMAFIKKINKNGGKILAKHFGGFIKKYFFVRGPIWAAGNPPELGKLGKGGKKSIYQEFKDTLKVTKHGQKGKHFDYSQTQSPQVIKFILCFDGGWRYIPSFKPFQGNATQPVSPNIFTNLGSRIEKTIKVRKALFNGRSTLDNVSLDPTIPLKVNPKFEFVMRFADRTPPRILGCVGGNFPELGKTKPASTGDWYKIEGIWAEDNTGCDIGMCLVLGKIDSFTSDWAKNEKWISEKVTTFKPNTQPNYVILPNTCHGVMHYSVFAWDTSNLMNPGEPGIIEDSPTTCYGLKPPLGQTTSYPPIDLGTDPRTAKGWPIKFISDPTDINKNNIDGKMRRGQGILHVKDNDLPNIVIKLESMKDHKKIFFPPLIEDGSLPIYDSSDYNSPSGTNSNEYSKFIDGAEEKCFSTHLKTTASSPFVILDAKPSSVMSPAESAKISSFISGGDKKLTSFARKHFRLEDYDESDTQKSDGKPRGDEDTFGSRNSFGESVVALLNKPLQEDVEYRISVWADDNVKWATVDKSGTILKKIISIPSGIDSGNIELNIPNQLPAYSSKITMDRNSSLSKTIRAVFREPTKGSSSSIAKLAKNRYPYIKVSVSDFSGHKREITLYFMVKNERPVIRVLEHKHGTI